MNTSTIKLIDLTDKQIDSFSQEDLVRRLMEMNPFGGYERNPISVNRAGLKNWRDRERERQTR